MQTTGRERDGEIRDSPQTKRPAIRHGSPAAVLARVDQLVWQVGEQWMHPFAVVGYVFFASLTAGSQELNSPRYFLFFSDGIHAHPLSCTS